MLKFSSYAWIQDVYALKTALATKRSLRTFFSRNCLITASSVLILTFNPPLLAHDAICSWFSWLEICISLIEAQNYLPSSRNSWYAFFRLERTKYLISSGRNDNHGGFLYLIHLFNCWHCISDQILELCEFFCVTAIIRSPTRFNTFWSLETCVQRNRLSISEAYAAKYTLQREILMMYVYKQFSPCLRPWGRF